MTDGAKYQIIYADPPWQFKNYSDAWHDGRAGSRWVGNEYRLMGQSDVEELPIKDMAADDATLFLWVTMPHLMRAKAVIEAWGFEYKTVAFVWTKQNKKSPTRFMGMGFWTRSNAELCLLATRGHPKRVSKSIRQIVDSPIERHSKKPDEVRNRIVDLLGDLPRIELFARERHEGWDAWGDEV